MAILVRIPPHRRPGQEILAEDFNAMVDALREAAHGMCRLEGRVASVEGRLAQITESIRCRVVARTGGAPDFPANITYTIRAYGREELELTGVVPTYSMVRPPLGEPQPLIFGQDIGSTCFLLRRQIDNEPAAETIFYGERLALEDCPG